MNGIGSHQSHIMGKDEWLTPPEILKSLAPFDLDPCAPIVRPWPTANKHYTIEDDGLKQNWVGRVWLNPPYGKHTGTWLNKLAEHGNGLALIFARTETEMFVEHVWKKADAVFFIFGRLYFYHVDGSKAKSNNGAPSCLIAYGENNVTFLEKCGIPGQLVKLKKALQDDSH